MSTTIVIPAVKSGFVQCYSSVYATARNGLGTGAAGSDALLYFGQNLNGTNYYVWQTHVAFDTGSVLPLGANVVSATVSFQIGQNKARVYHFDAELSSSTYTGNISTSHWKDPDTIVPLSTVTVDDTTSSTDPNLDVFLTFPTSADLAAYVNAVGYTSFCVSSKQQRLSDAPDADGNTEYILSRAAKIANIISLSSVQVGTDIDIYAYGYEGSEAVQIRGYRYRGNNSEDLALHYYNVSGSDGADATSLAACINHATYGFDGVVAQKISGQEHVALYLSGDDDMEYLEITPETGHESEFTLTNGVSVRPYMTVEYDVVPTVYVPSVPVLTTPDQQEYVYECVSHDIEPFISHYDDMMAESRIATAMSFVPDASNTNYNRIGNICGALDTASRHARNLATVYMCNHDTDYSDAVRDIIYYWATHTNTETPPTYVESHNYTSDGDNAYNFGFHMSWGCYAFALAYDLTKNSSSYSDADRIAIVNWFDLWALAEATYLVHWYNRESYAFSHPDLWTDYSWTVNPLGLQAKAIEQYTSSDPTAGVMHALIAANNIAGNTNINNFYLYNSLFPLNAWRLNYFAANSENDGDGVPGHPIPVPQVQIDANSKEYTPAGKPGNITYMFFNARFHSCIGAAMVNNGSYTAVIQDGIGDGEYISAVANVYTDMKKMWRYLDRYTGNGTQGVDYENPPQGTGDTYDMDDMVAYEHIGAYLTNDQQLINKVKDYVPSDEIYEAQSTGFTRLVCPLMYQNEYSYLLRKVRRGHKKPMRQLSGD